MKKTIEKLLRYVSKQTFMENDEKRKSLFRSLQLSSTAGNAIMIFALALVVFYYAKLDWIYAIPLSAVFSIITTLARSRSRL